jgi:hypothetical protein
MRTLDLNSGTVPISQRRPFRIADGMVLIAALFVALAWGRAGGLDLPGFLFRFGAMFRPPYAVWNLAQNAANVVLLLLPFLVLGSLSVFALRLQPPRPDLRQLLREPGWVACAVATLAIIPIGTMVFATHLFSGRPVTYALVRAVDDLKPENLSVLATLIGLAVLVAWTVMKARGLWRPEATWIDRSGRVLGGGWILMILGGMLQLVLSLVRLASA